MLMVYANEGAEFQAISEFEDGVLFDTDVLIRPQRFLRLIISKWYWYL